MGEIFSVPQMVVWRNDELFSVLQILYCTAKLFVEQFLTFSTKIGLSKWQFQSRRNEKNIHIYIHIHITVHGLKGYEENHRGK